MNIFKKIVKEAKDLDETIEFCKKTPTPEPEEEWIWVEGYKGTDKDMRCRDYQYELGVQYDMPDGEDIEACKNGFHLCLNLADVYRYYQIGDGNRFFKVKALVRTSDVKEYRSTSWITWDGQKYYTHASNDKLTSKSIIFLSELTSSEILEDTDAHKLPSQYHQIARDRDVECAVKTYQTDTLIEDGYSEAFAWHLVYTNKFDIAHDISSQKDLSMDVKVLYILQNG